MQNDKIAEALVYAFVGLTVLTDVGASPTMSSDRLLLNALFTAWVAVGARWEERDLIVQYGDAYRRSQASVPMLFPWRVAAPRSTVVTH